MVARSLAILSASLLALVLAPAPAEAHPVVAYCDPNQGQVDVWWRAYADQFDPNQPNTWGSALLYANTYWQGGCLGTGNIPGVCFVDAGQWPQSIGCEDNTVPLPWCSVMCDWNLPGLDGLKDWPPKECLEVPKPGDPYRCPIL